MTAIVRAEIRVQGQVQGVGFRPFVYRLAHELGLAGWVRNDGQGVAIALEGTGSGVARLLERLREGAPARARIDAIEVDLEQPAAGLRGFRIGDSAGGAVRTAVPADVAVCERCVEELFDARDRRHGYPFINCIHCGPRFTITRRLPYDRPHTSMAPFRLCRHCAAEYHDPASRRFHAQPNACAQCGPRLRLLSLGADGTAPASAPGLPTPAAADGRAATATGAAIDVVGRAARQLQQGQVLAVQGLGGFHLVCDARNALPLARLRAGKRRRHKPFAVMVLNLASAAALVELDAHQAQLLASPERPVVLLRMRAAGERALAAVSPGLARLGLMLPHTPLHWLLFHALLGRPPGPDWRSAACDIALVMTSANPGGEPLVIDEAEARAGLAGLADALLVNDRAIVQRCDDSVMRCDRGVPSFVRRARGFVPQRIRLPASGPSVLACGAGRNNTVCVTRGDEAFVSQHIGDLAHAGARAMLEDCVAHLCRLLEVAPQAVAHDLHPDEPGSGFAAAFAARHGLPCLAIQHHHAHVAAVVAEHGIPGAVIGLALDGLGLGSDGGLWGGELLRVEGPACARLGHLRTLPLPGGDAAAREPWRMAAAVLHALGRAGEIAARFAGQPAAAQLATLLDSAVRCPPTSSAGRCFDAAAALLGVVLVQSHEAQAAMQLEALAERHGPVAPMPLAVGDRELDLLPVLAVLADCRQPGYGAALFHASLAAALAGWAARAARDQQLDTVVLAGGCLLNGVLREALDRQLRRQGLEVRCASRVPPGDGAISLGQAWVALQSLPRGN